MALRVYAVSTARRVLQHRASSVYFNNAHFAQTVKLRSFSSSPINWKDYIVTRRQDSREGEPFGLLNHAYVDGADIPRSGTRIPEEQRVAEYVPAWDKMGIPIRWMYQNKKNNLSRKDVLFPHLWLRDNCRCAHCVNQDTMQRAFDTFSIPRDIMPRKVTIEKAGLRVTWANDGHISFYPWEWLYKHQPYKGLREKARRERAEGELTYWGAEIKNHPPSVHYDEIMADDKGVGKWTSKIRQFGFCFVDGCPVSPEKTQELIERIAFVRITHYGGFYDFTSDLTMKDTAYTSLALQAHTDTTYFTDPAGLQMFHLLSHTNGSGGASLLVDGFKAAEMLRKADFEAYKTLCQMSVSWHASGNDGITITPGQPFPVLNFRTEVDFNLQSLDIEPLMQVRWNNDDRGPLVIRSYHQSDPRHAMKWYEAARLWDSILKKKSMEYWEQLKPGRPLIFDNWRVLHGRSAFTGKRRICGGYVNHDDYISRWRNTNYTREEALLQIL